MTEHQHDERNQSPDYEPKREQQHDPSGERDADGHAVNGVPNDADFDRWLQSAARDYNRPVGTVPTAAMWNEIARALPAVADAVRVVPRDPVKRRRGVATTWWRAAAALLLVAGGVGIGRAWRGAVSTGSGIAASASAHDSPDVAVDQPSGSTARMIAPSTAAVAPAGTGESRAPASVAPPAERGSYDRAAVEHLSRAEALLTSFRTPPADAGTTSLNRWARDLLGDTRLLLDSPAATDARRRALLEDLEMVLAQIVQLPAESSADRGLVQRSIERGAVLSRIRSSIPAGYASGT